MTVWGWVVPHKDQRQTLEDFPCLKDQFERVKARLAVQRGFTLGRDLRKGSIGDKIKDAKEVRKTFFGQSAH